jgi:hypothetical protein
MRRAVVVLMVLVMLTSCSGNSDVQNGESESSSTESQTAPLTPEEKSILIASAKKLNVSYDDFDEVYVVDSRPSQSCPGHTIWLQIKAGTNGLTEAEFFLLTQDDINSNIGSPGGVLIKQNGNTFSYPVEDWIGLDNIYCGGSEWAYQSKQQIYADQQNTDSWLDHFSDPTSKFRLENSWRDGGYRDIELGAKQRELNLTAMKVFNSLTNGQITPKELFGN